MRLLTAMLLGLSFSLPSQAYTDFLNLAPLKHYWLLSAFYNDKTWLTHSNCLGFLLHADLPPQ